MQSQCALCKHSKEKIHLFGGIRYHCLLTQKRVEGNEVCDNYFADGDKVLRAAGFRSHTCGSMDACDCCAHCDGDRETGKVRYCCKRLNVRFWEGFQPLEYICDEYVDGGVDALVDRFAEWL